MLNGDDKVSTGRTSSLTNGKGALMRQIENLFATSAKEEAQSIVAAALAKLENLTSVRQSAYAFAA